MRFSKRDRKAAILADRQRTAAAKKERKLVAQSIDEQRRAEKLIRRGWDLRPVQGREDSSEWFKGNIYAATSAEACRIEAEIPYRVIWANQVMEYLTAAGWVKSKNQNAWMLPNWEKEEGCYIANLRHAYRTQMKLDDKAEEVAAAEAAADL